MLKVTTQYIRENSETPFHSSRMSAELFEYFKMTYRDTEKLLSVSITVSDDSLTMISEWVWSTQEDYNEWLADPATIAWHETRSSHNAENFIVMNPTLLAEVTEI